MAGDLTDEQMKAVVDFARGGADAIHVKHMVDGMLTENQKRAFAEEMVKAMAEKSNTGILMGAGAIQGYQAAAAAAQQQGKIRSLPPDKMFSVAAAKWGGFYVYESHPRYVEPGHMIEPAFCASTLEEVFSWIQNKWALNPEEK